MFKTFRRMISYSSASWEGEKMKLFTASLVFIIAFEILLVFCFKNNKHVILSNHILAFLNTLHSLSLSLYFVPCEVSQNS